VLTIIGGIIMSLFIYTQYLYYLIFGDFYSGNAIFASDLTDKTFIDSAWSLISLKSMSLLVPMTVMLLTYAAFRKDITRTPINIRIKVISLTLFILQPLNIYAGNMRRLYLWSNTDGSMTLHETYLQQQVILNYPDSPHMLAKYLGPGFLLYHFCTTLNTSEISLTSDERRYLADRISAPINCGDTTKIRRDNSMILIFVESFNSSVLDIPEAREVLPVITSLIEDSGTVVARQVLTQVSHGESSDGQFIATTGLLPLRNGAFVSHFSKSDYPSLPKALGYSSTAEVICESARIWQHANTTQSYGYDRLYDMSVDDSQPDSDAQVFKRAACLIDSMTPPYMLMVSTIGMHMPYLSTINVSQPLDVSGQQWLKYDNRCLNYMIATHEFDRALGIFIDSVQSKARSSGIEPPVIAIIGDHATPRNSLTAPLHTDYVPLIVCNTGRNLDYAYPIGQIDVFPTLLDIMHIGSYILPSTGKPYRGLGTSILSPTPPVGAISADGKAVEGTANPEAKTAMWLLSDSLIRSRFFNK